LLVRAGSFSPVGIFVVPESPGAPSVLLYLGALREDPPVLIAYVRVMHSAGLTADKSQLRGELRYFENNHFMAHSALRDKL